MINKVETKYVTIVDRGKDADRVREIWIEGRRLGICPYEPDPPPTPSAWEKNRLANLNRNQKAVYQEGDRVVLEKSKSPYLTIGKTYAVVKVHQGTFHQYLHIENSKGRSVTANAENFRPAKPDELEIK